jgi:putative transposase
MPKGLVRRHRAGDLHFVTISCHRHAHVLKEAEACRILQRILEETRQRYGFHVVGYVFMSNHIHLLVTEPEEALISTAIQVLKQRFSRTRTEEFVRKPRYHDFNVYSNDKRVEKLRYMHRNPVKAGVVERPEDYPWSSYRAYAFGEPHPIFISCEVYCPESGESE